jgi:hydroxypyruvate reductase
MIDRATCTTAFYEAVAVCDPAARVREALAQQPLRGRDVIGLAIGKAAIAMARGAGPVARGLVVAPRRPGSQVVDELSAGWTICYAAHPMPDDSSFAAGAQVLELVAGATVDDVVLALVSGGASSLVEQPLAGIDIDEYRARVRAVMASGASIQELNRVRTELSAIKGGKLAARSAAPVVTLVVSDVIGDDPRVIGSGPTVGEPLRAGDRALVVAPIASFGVAISEALADRAIDSRRIAQPIAEDVAVVADGLAHEHGVVVAWGEPTVRVPERAGSGGRAQQLALELARRLRGTDRSAFVAGSDGIDGPSPRGAAGAYVDGTTWDAIGAMRIDAAAALERCDAGTALDAVGALVVTGPTGINHADVVILG